MATMPKPVRLQLRRNRGYRLQEVSRAINGLEAVKVDRTTRWGNPERVVRDEMRWDGASEDEAGNPIEHGPWLCLGRGSTFPPEPGKPFSGWWFSTKREAAQKAVDFFRFRMTTDLGQVRLSIADDLSALRGKSLACWCKPGEPCHADVLLELANA